MEMHQVRYFLAVAEELNFTRASERCHVTQPSLSRAIKLLEEELGGLLFRRERESTHLTDLGALVRPHLQSVYDHSTLARRLSQEFATKWPLKLGIMSTISPDEVIDLIANIRTRHPDVELRLCDANAQELRTRLLAGDLEVAIYASPGEQPNERMHAIPLFRERMVLAVHRQHRLARTGAFPVREMNGENYIHRMNCEFAGYADKILEEKGVTCKPVYWSEREDWTLALVAAGLGFAHARKRRQAPRRDRSAGHRAGILAASEPRERERAPPLAGGRLAGARGDAEEVVRKEAGAGDRMWGCRAGSRRRRSRGLMPKALRGRPEWPRPPKDGGYRIDCASAFHLKDLPALNWRRAHRRDRGARHGPPSWLFSRAQQKSERNENGKKP
jgi:DNA-binding transcriptional LysR family regulator